MDDNWLSELNDVIENVIEDAGRKPLLALGFTLSELVESKGERLARAKEALLASPLLDGLGGDRIVRVLATAVGADGAREAFQGGVIDEALADKVDPEDVAAVTAESIVFDEFLARRLEGAKEVLAGQGVRFADEDDERRLYVAYIAKTAYERCIAAYVADGGEL